MHIVTDKARSSRKGGGVLSPVALLQAMFVNLQVFSVEERVIFQFSGDFVPIT